MDIFKSEETTVVDFRLAAHKNRTTVMDQLGQDGSGSYIIRPTIHTRPPATQATLSKNKDNEWPESRATMLHVFK